MRLPPVLALALCAVSTPAFAQDFTIDPAAIDSCLASSPDAPMSCVGKQADVCYNDYGGGPNMVMAACQEAEIAHWDRLLNVTYAQILKRAAENEADDLGYQPDQLTDSTRDMQRAWIAYRDATCTLAVAQAMPFGSAAGPAEAGCKMRETARQVFQLQQIERSFQ